LLPSLLNVQFRVRAGTNATQFGLDVTSRALCNSDHSEKNKGKKILERFFKGCTFGAFCQIEV
jgi:hypothetical protein